MPKHFWGFRYGFFIFVPKAETRSSLIGTEKRWIALILAELNQFYEGMMVPHATEPIAKGLNDRGKNFSEYGIADYSNDTAHGVEPKASKHCFL